MLVRQAADEIQHLELMLDGLAARIAEEVESIGHPALDLADESIRERINATVDAQLSHLGRGLDEMRMSLKVSMDRERLALLSVLEADSPSPQAVTAARSVGTVPRTRFGGPDTHEEDFRDGADSEGLYSSHLEGPERESRPRGSLPAPVRRAWERQKRASASAARRRQDLSDRRRLRDEELQSLESKRREAESARTLAESVGDFFTLMGDIGDSTPSMPLWLSNLLTSFGLVGLVLRNDGALVAYAVVAVAQRLDELRNSDSDPIAKRN